MVILYNLGKLGGRISRLDFEHYLSRNLGIIGNMLKNV